MIKTIKRVFYPNKDNKQTHNNTEKNNLYAKLYSLATPEQKEILSEINPNEFSKIKNFIFVNPDLQEKLIKTYYSNFTYIKTLKEFEENFTLINIQGETEDELKEKNAILAMNNHSGENYLILLLPIFNFISNFTFDNIAFGSMEVMSYFFKKTLTLEEEEGEKVLSFTELLEYMEESNINDFHIRALNENKYIFTGRINQEVIRIGSPKPASVIEDLILQAKIMMGKDTSTIKPEDTGFIRYNFINKKGVPVIRNFRVNIVMASKLYTQTYSISIRRLMTMKEIATKGLKGLGYIPEGIDLIKKIQFRRTGLSIVSGSTNSGKTTLLACVLNELYQNRIQKGLEKRIISIENPVEIVAEYDQIDLSLTENADEDKKMTVQRAIKAILRNDPDAILISEVRTNEEINQFIAAGLTGRNTFTTIHASNVKTTILRILKGADNPLDVLTNLNGVISQTLVSKICKNCNGTGEINGKKCHICRGTGKNGMVPIYEIAYFKRVNPAKFLNDKNEIELKQFFDFEKLIEAGEIEYISKTQVAKHFYEKGDITKEDYIQIKENEEEMTRKTQKEIECLTL